MSEPAVPVNVGEIILQDRLVSYAITDRTLNVVEVGGAAALSGRENGAWSGRSLLEVVPELIGSERVLADVLEGRLPRFELAWINRETPDGCPAYLITIDLPYRDSHGQITGLIHVTEDWTDTGCLQQQLAQERNELRLLQAQLALQNLEVAAANAELRRLDELKSRFVSVAAHELRTPLSAISGYVEMLLDDDFGPLTPEQRKPLEVMGRSANRLLIITRNLLDITRIEAGYVRLVLQPVDLFALLERVAEEHMPEVDAHGHHLTIPTEHDLPRVLCDEVRAAQIIGNLLSNAVEYTPDGGQIRADVTCDDQEGFLRVSVSDNGIGICKEDQARVFTRFYRGENARQSRRAGAGLGLYITRALVELHGGRIWLESEPGAGSTFYVTFPVAA